MRDHRFGKLLAAAGAALVLFGADARAFPVNVQVDAGTPVRPIDDNIFGVRPHWSGVHGGFGTANASQTQYFTAMDRLNAYLDIAAEIRPTVLHWPGGLDANTFPWKKSIGRFESRGVLTTAQKGGYPDNKVVYGLDEFMQTVEDLGAEAIIAVPMQVTGVAPDINGTIGDDADMVEYLNAPNDGSNPDWQGKAPNDPTNIDWAARRAANGHPAPYGVKYFEMGVEIRHGLFWSSATYANVFCQYTDAMRDIDPTIKFGVVGDDAPYYFDAIQPVGFRFQKWFEITGNYIQQFCTPDGADRIGFWQRHPYSPTGSAPVRGFSISKQNVFVEKTETLPVADDWTFRVQSAGGDVVLASPVDLGFFVDGNLVENRTISTEATQEFTVNLSAGPHTIRVQKMDQDAGSGTGVNLLVYHRIFANDSTNTFEVVFDLKDSDQLYPVVQAGADYQSLYLDEPQPWLLGKPVYVTEWSWLYDRPNDACLDQGECDLRGEDLREPLQLATYYEKFAELGIELTTHHQLFEQRQFGMIEGVAIDDRDPLDGVGRDPSQVRRRPMFHLFKLYRDNVLGTLIQASNDSPTYSLGPANGLSMGSSGIFDSVDLPWATQLASLSADGTEMSVILRNRHRDDDAQATISLSGFDFAPNARVQTWTGPATYSNNEFDPAVCSNPPACAPQVGTTETVLAVPGANFAYTVPAHSVVAIKFLKNGADKTPPAAPTGFHGSINGAHTQVTLGWNVSPPADFDHYAVYKAVNAVGPWERVIAQLPRTTVALVDTDLFPGRKYSYAIAAVDAAGNVSARSNAVSFSVPDDPPDPPPGCAAVAPGAGGALGGLGAILACAFAIGASRRRR